MISSLHHDQPIIENAQSGIVAVCVNSFLIDRKAAGLQPHTVKFYRIHLAHITKHCHADGVTRLEDVSPDLLRGYLLALAESHNPGGVHGYFRSLRAFFRWVLNEEVMPAQWKNPMHKVKPPKVSLEALEPVSLEDVRALIDACTPGQFADERDRAVFLFLLDTGARAQETCDTTVQDVDLNTGEVTIRHGKGGKSRTVFLGRKTRRAMRSYLRLRTDHCPALFVSRTADFLSYDGLRQILERRALRAGLTRSPTLHDFRRAFALNMLRNGVDVFALQRLLGHADLQVMRRYLAQNNTGTQAAHMRGSPVDNGL